MDDFILEEKIKKALDRRAKDVHVDRIVSRRIQENVHQRLEEENGMKHRNWKKLAVTAAAICVLGSITAMAIGKGTVGISHSSRNEMVYTYGEAAAKQKDFNSKVKSVEEFSNGYQFANAVPVYGEEKDENGNTVNKTTSMSFRYKKDGLDTVNLDGHPSSMKEASEPDQTMVLENGIELRCFKLHSKFVPPDYVATEEEKQLAKEGKLNLAYGSSEIEEMNSLSVFWLEDGITYSLFTFEESLTAEEMFRMAKEVIESRQ